MIYTLQPDIFAVNETWLVSEIPDGTVITSAYYSHHRKDMSDTNGEGVALLVEKDIWSVEVRPNLMTICFKTSFQI